MPIDAPYPKGEAADELAGRSLNPLARDMLGSQILGIASQVKAKIAAGEDICNLTVGIQWVREDTELRHYNEE